MKRDHDDMLSPNVRTDRADAAQKLQVLGRMIKDYELLTRRTTLLDPDAKEILILRRVLGDLIEKNHLAGYRAAKELLARLETTPPRRPPPSPPSSPRMRKH